jgi:glucose-6-phosphate-specific signal transduction histidine kinase
MSSHALRPPASLREPWFRQRPRIAVAVIATLFVVVLAARLLTGSPADAFSMLYVLPVALAATTFGRRGGVPASLLAVALIGAWVVAREVHLTPTGWATRVVPILLLGFLLGRAVDRLREAEDDRRRLERAALLHREAIEINDSLIQRMSAAKWSLEAGQTDTGLRILTAAVSDAQQMVSGLITRADMSERSETITGAASPAGRS